MSICTITDYAESVTDLETRLVRYKTILAALDAGLESFIPNAGIQQHKLNDSQVVIETAYRSITDYVKDIRSIEMTINSIKQQLTGGVSYSKPHSSFSKRGY